jgi:hypothetical protein
MQKFIELWQSIYKDAQEKKTELLNSITAEGFVEVKQAIEVFKIVGKYEMGIDEANDLFANFIAANKMTSAPTEDEGAE